MNTSKTLLAILVEYLPKNGGWPKGVARLAQDPDGDIQMLSNRHAYLVSAGWTGDGREDFYGQYAARKLEPLASDYATAIITREQYEAALAASKEPLTGTGVDGWIDWAGGECPVEEGTLVDVRYRDGEELSALPANDFAKSHRDASHAFWRNDGSQNDIIAYRLHQPQEAEQAKADDEADLNDCIGQVQSNDQARDEILYELANFAASTGTSLDIGAATQIAIWLSDKGYRKQ